MSGEPLPASFYERPALEVARELVGCTLVHGGCMGRIVETEAYTEEEAACHAHIGRTPRTEVLFGPPGRAYVYVSYGIHFLLNAVVGPEGYGAAVLIRAAEPKAGLELMRSRRGLERPADLCSGPGKLTQAFGVDLGHNRGDLAGGRGPTIHPADGEPAAIVTGPRIGITKAAELPWRFCEAGSRFVSSPRPRG